LLDRMQPALANALARVQTASIAPAPAPSPPLARLPEGGDAQ
jgi:hypothetical protein